MLRYLCILLVIQAVFASVSPNDTRVDDDGVDPEILEGLDDNDEDARREMQETVDKFTQQIVEKVKANGYPMETHSVRTADGFILGVHRIPNSPSNGPALDKPIVFLQHGIISSSNVWIIPRPGKGLAYILADLGYDVWMGNARGNLFSKNHEKLSPKSTDFWDFSWHQIGYYDLPAMIDYVLQTTRQSSLNFVGHSQGATSFFVLASLHPEFNRKIRAMHALGPTAFMSNAPNPFFRAFAPIVTKFSILNKLLGSYEFLPSSTFMKMAGSTLCMEQSIVKSVCANILFLVAGFDQENLNQTVIPEILQVVPAGTSVNQFIHYSQSFSSGHFREYDYGMAQNVLKYWSLSPPDYPLEKITAPVHVYYGNNDWLAGIADVQILASKLTNLVYNKMVPHPMFNHLDFLWAFNAYDLLYADLIENIQKYT